MPAHHTPQELLQSQMVESLSDPRIAKIASRYACKSIHIKERFHEVPGFSSDLIGANSDLRLKMIFFKEIVNQRFNQLYEDEPQAPSTLIHVTCTGYVAPSPAQELVVRKGWSQQTSVLHAYHMGCYAAFPAVRMASGEIASQLTNKDPSSRVDVVHSELCSLHFQGDKLADPEQVVVQTLFADGYIKYSMSARRPEGEVGFRVICLHQEQIPNTQQMMTWVPDARGFQMSLSREVPLKIKENLSNFVSTLLKSSEADVRVEDLMFAIHPGGPLIISEVQKSLLLSDEQVLHSKEVLYTRGNMSSVTVPLIWKRIAEDQNIRSGQHVLGLAFGPGLTVYGGIFQKL